MSLSTETNLEGKACSQLFELVKDYLNKLSCCGRFLDDLSAQEEESIDFLSTSCSLLRELGRVSGETSGIESIFSSFKEALSKDKKKEVKLEEIFSKPYLGDREWIDEVNYIYVWVLNSYGLNLKTSTMSEIQSQFGSQQTVEVEVQPAQSDVEVEVEEGRHASQRRRGRARRKHWNGLSIYRNIFRTHRLGDLDEDESFEYIVSKTQALERLEREIRSGRVYIYSSKPFRIPILKKYFSYLCLAGLAISGVAFFKAAISGGISGTSGRQTWDPILFTIMSFIFFFLSWRENNRGLENDNFKYCFSRRIFFYYFFLSSFFVVSIFEKSGSNSGGYYSIFSQTSDVGHTVIFAILMAVVILSVTFFLVGFFFLNPKKNKPLIESLLNKYSNPPYLNN